MARFIAPENSRYGLNLDRVTNWRSSPVTFDIVGLADALDQPGLFVRLANHGLLTVSTW